MNNGLPCLIHHVCTRLFCAYFSKKAIWSQNIYIWSLLSLTFWWQITEHAKLLSSQKNDIVTKNSGSAACHNKSQMRETGSCAQRKRYSGATSWEDSGLPSQRPSPLPAQAHGSYGSREGKVLFLSIRLACFWCIQALSIHLSSFGCTQRKNLPLHRLGQ